MTNVNDIKKLLGEIQQHYDKHVNNKFVKNIFMKLDLPISTVQNMNLVLSGNMVYFDSRGAIEDMYNGVIAVCEFANEVYQKILPNMSLYTQSSFMGQQQNLSPNDKILSQMAIKNYPMNIKILFDLIYQLFKMIYDFDIANFAKDPAFKRVNGFPEFEKNLEDIKVNMQKLAQH